MVSWRIPHWVLPAALCGVAAMALADLVLMRRHPVSTQAPAVTEKIGLYADAEGEALRVQWNRGSRPVRNADHAILYIADGTLQSQLDLTGRQLDTASVVYQPESEQVNFRLEVYRGRESTSDSVVVGAPQAKRRRRRSAHPRAMVERLRPSPFERVEPEIVEVEMLPAPAAATGEPEPPPEPEPVAAEMPKEGGLSRFIGKIPLIRGLQRHRQAPETAPR